MKDFLNNYHKKKMGISNYTALRITNNETEIITSYDDSNSKYGYSIYTSHKNEGVFDRLEISSEHIFESESSAIKDAKELIENISKRLTNILK